MSEAKSLGQVAHEATSSLSSGRLTFADPLPWAKVPRWMKDEYEASAQAVAKAVAEECAQMCAERAKRWPDDGGDAASCELAIREKFGISGST